jgi:hypothetical protein
MKVFPRYLVAAIAVLMTGLGASAQQPIGFGGPGYNPPLSPYLNLNRVGAPPAINYYNLVQPQVQFGSSIVGLQQQQGVLQTEIAAGGGPTTALPTGHSVAFGNLSHFYSQRGLAGVGGGGVGGFGGVGVGGAAGGVAGGAAGGVAGGGGAMGRTGQGGAPTGGGIR